MFLWKNSEREKKETTQNKWITCQTTKKIGYNSTVQWMTNFELAVRRGDVVVCKWLLTNNWLKFNSLRDSMWRLSAIRRANSWSKCVTQCLFTRVLKYKPIIHWLRIVADWLGSLRKSQNSQLNCNWIIDNTNSYWLCWIVESLANREIFDSIKTSRADYPKIVRLTRLLMNAVAS